MEFKRFVCNLNLASCELDKRKIRSIVKSHVKASMNEFGDNNRILVIAIEELSELQKELSKKIRGKGNRHKILEECADVCISLMCIQDVNDIKTSDLYKAINVKIDRIQGVLKDKGVYK